MGFVASNPALARVEQAEASESSRRAEEVRKEVVRELAEKSRQELAEEKRRYKGLWCSMESAFGVFLADMEKQAAEQLVGLSLKAAELIIRRELPDRAAVAGIVRETLEPVMDLKGANVRVHPLDAEWLRNLREEDGTARLGGIQVVADSSLSRGDVLIESRNGYFDARISERLKLLEERLNERYRKAHEDGGKS